MQGWCLRLQAIGLLPGRRLSTLSDHWSIDMHGTVYAFRPLVYCHEEECYRLQTIGLLINCHAEQKNVHAFRPLDRQAGDCLLFQITGLLTCSKLSTPSDHWSIAMQQTFRSLVYCHAADIQITGLLPCSRLSTLSGRWSIDMQETVYAFRSLVYWHAWDCLRFQVAGLLTCSRLSTPSDHWSIARQETVYAFRPLIYWHAGDCLRFQVAGLLTCKRRSTPSDHWSIAMQSKTEMTACVQGNKSKHTRG